MGPMLALLSAAALAVAPPSFELLDDIDRWEDGMDNVLQGPRGCWDFSGDFKQTVTLHQPPDFFSAARIKDFVGKGSFKARLKDGVWVTFDHAYDPSDNGIATLGKVVGEMDEESKEEDWDPEDFEIPVVPLVGEVPSEMDEEDVREMNEFLGDDASAITLKKSVNLLRQAVDEWAGRTETAVAQWDSKQEAVMFLREIPVADDDPRPIHIDVRFPAAGEYVDRIDAVWPRIVKIGKWPIRLTIRDAQMHLLAYQHDGMSLPRAESLSLVVGFMGFTMGFEQTLKFKTAARCTAAGPAAKEEG